MADRLGKRAVTMTIGVALAAAIGGFAAARARRRATNVGPRDSIERTITVGATAARLYDAWTTLLPQTMDPFAAVTLADDSRVRWQLGGPGGSVYETVVERTRPGDVLTWTNVEPAAKPFSGAVRFQAAPGDRGTEVSLRLLTSLPPGVVGQAATMALRRFKSLIETGELPTLEHNPSGRPAGLANGDS